MISEKKKEAILSTFGLQIQIQTKINAKKRCFADFMTPLSVENVNYTTKNLHFNFL